MPGRVRALGAILMRFGTGRIARVAAIAASICLLLTLAPGLSAESSVTVSVSTVPTSIKLYRNLYAGATVDTNAADIRPTADGGAVAVGVTTSPAGYPVGWVLKLDASGNAQWSEDVGAAFTYPSSVEPTGDGGVVLAGGTQGGSGAVCDPLSGRECAWVAKLGPGGAVEWQRVYATGTSTLQVAWDIRQTTDGGYVVAGGSGAQTAYGAWVAKLDPAGNVEWQQVFGGTSHLDLANFESVRQTADGGYVAAGWNTAGYDESGIQRLSAFVVRFDPIGGVLWETAYTNVDSTEANIGGARANAIVQASDGGFLVGGAWTNLASPVGADFLLLKLHPSGDIDWQRAYDGGVRCFDGYIGRQCTRLGGFIYDVQRSPDGGYLLSGIGHAIEEDNPWVQAWLGKVDPGGNFLWQNTFFAARTANAFYGVGATADGGVVTIGTMAIYEPESIQNAMYIVKRDPNGNVASCSDVHAGAPLMVLNPSLVLNTPSLPIDAARGSSAPAAGSSQQTSVRVTGQCGDVVPSPLPPLKPSKRPKKHG